MQKYDRAGNRKKVVAIKRLKECWWVELEKRLAHGTSRGGEAAFGHGWAGEMVRKFGRSVQSKCVRSLPRCES